MNDKVFLVTEMLDWVLKTHKSDGSDKCKEWLFSQMTLLDTLSSAITTAAITLYKQEPAVCKRIWEMSYQMMPDSSIGRTPDSESGCFRFET